MVQRATMTLTSYSKLKKPVRTTTSHQPVPGIFILSGDRKHQNPAFGNPVP